MRLDLGVGGAGTDDELVAGVLDAVEPVDLADMDHLGQIAKLLGDPQPHVRRPGDDRRVRMLLVEVGERLERRRRGEERPLVADEHVLAVGKEAEHAGHVLAGDLEAVAARAGRDREPGVDDRPIAGAAAEIAGEPGVDLGAAERAGGRLVHREQRHHEAGRAEAALRSVALDQRRLHRVQAAVAARRDPRR